MNKLNIAHKLLYMCLGCGITTGALAVIHDFRPAEIFALITFLITLGTLVFGIAANRKAPEK